MQQAICRRLVITGRVQGVYYRASAREAALERGLTGWVRNRRDGSVEAVVCGSSAQVQDFVAWARQGPPGARVDRVEESDSADTEHHGFELRPTV